MATLVLPERRSPFIRTRNPRLRLKGEARVGCRLLAMALSSPQPHAQSPRDGLSLSLDFFADDFSDEDDSSPPASSNVLEATSSLALLSIPHSSPLHCRAESFAQVQLWASPPEDMERSAAANRRAGLREAGRRAASQVCGACAKQCTSAEASPWPQLE